MDGVPTLRKVGVRIGCCNLVQRQCECCIEGCLCSRLRSTQAGLEFGKGQFDRRQIGRVGGQLPQFTPGSFDDRLYAHTFMDAEIIHHHHLPWLQPGDEELFEIGYKRGGIHGSRQRHGGTHATRTQRRHHRRIRWRIAWHTPIRTLSTRRACIAGRQVEVCAALVQNHEALGRALRDALPEVVPLLLVAFTRTQCLFFRVQPTRRTTRLMVATLTRTPASVAHC